MTQSQAQPQARPERLRSVNVRNIPEHTYRGLSTLAAQYGMGQNEIYLMAFDVFIQNCEPDIRGSKIKALVSIPQG